jgi:hypothetical protein
MTVTNEQANLDAALAAFTATSALPGEVRSPLKSLSPAQKEEQQALALELEEAEPEEVSVDQFLASEDEETPAEEETTDETSDFAAQFEENFGIKPDEAVNLVNGLQKFRQEMDLMRTWGVAPGEFDTRMASVREFYEKLPEADRGQFDNPAGAVAIWNHLEKNSPRKSSSTKRRGNVRTAPAAPAQEFIKRSQILAMNDAELRANYGRINAAYRENRVLENE